jgi:hypothetical protein
MGVDPGGSHSSYEEARPLGVNAQPYINRKARVPQGQPLFQWRE